MSISLDSPISKSAVDTSATSSGLEHHLGSALRPGAKLEIWSPSEKLGILECKSLTETRLEVRIRGHFLGRAFDVSGSLELEPWGRCTIELGHLRDPEARYCLQRQRAILISEGFDDHAPSLRFWADKVATRVEIRCTADRVRPQFDLTLTPPRCLI